MKFLSFVVVIMLVSSFNFSCKKDMPEVQTSLDEKPILNCIPQKTIAFSQDGQNTVQFVFNADSQVVKILMLQDYDTTIFSPYLALEYNGEGRVVRINDDRKMGGYFEYEYDQNGRLLKSKYFGFDDKQASGRTLQNIRYYLYNNEGNVTETRLHNSNDHLHGKSNFTYDSKGNIIKIEDSVLYEDGYKFSALREFRYDDKLNPQHKISLPFNFFFLSTNNLIFRKAQYYNINQITTTETTCSYTYNNGNLPQSVEISVYDPRFGTGSAISNYKYNCK